MQNASMALRDVQSGDPISSKNPTPALGHKDMTIATLDDKSR
jgi:hypothetical protein